MTFDDLNLNKPLLNALDELGYKIPTTIQERAFSVIMSGRDICGIAQTGTGKTFAYLLPCLRQWQYTKDRFPQIVILVPTRELVVQVVESVQQLSKYLSLSVTGVYGGVNMKPQIMAVENGVDVVVGTPGRFMDLVLQGSLRLKAVKKLVIDEVDEMLNLGFRTQLQRIFDVLPERRQNLMFSATLTAEVEEIIAAHFNNPVRVEAAPMGTPLENINQSAYEVPNFHSKVNLLKYLLHENPAMNKVLIFTSTKALADLLYDEIEPVFSEQTGIIHSNKAQNNRFNAVSRFREGTYRLLIATDIVARGIDIAEVSHVINFDMPDVPENYIHRIGRTGRADQRGIAISFLTPGDTEERKAVEALMQYEIPLISLPEAVELSEVLLPHELPKVAMRETLVHLPKIDEGGGAFHEKLAKNKKVNVKISHADKMKMKYGKPKTRGAKRK